MSTSLGSNLSELDRLLLELNAVQHNPPGFPADEANSSPPLPGALSPLYGVPETNSPLGGKAGPLTKEKPKRNGGRGLEDVRPSVESLLDELESSVPSPVPAITVNQGEMSSPQRVTSTQQQTRISASSATRELDELMASLSDFKTSSSTVALSAPGLSSSAPSSYCSLPPSPPPMPSVFLPPTTIPSPRGQGHTPEFPCTEQSGRGLLPPVAPSWLDLAGLGVMPDTFNSRSPSVEGSLWAVGTESQGRDWRHLPTITSELSGAPRCHTVPCAGSTALQEPGEPQGPPASPSCPEEALAATWEQPWASEVFGPERMPPSGAARSFQEVTEPAVVAVDRQAIFPDTWTLTEEHGLQQERPRPEPGRLGSSSPASVTTEQLGAKMTERGSVARPTQGPETPRSPEGTTEAATQDGKEQPELPCAMAMGTPSTTERISTSGQIRSVIRRSWESGHAHPMSREPSPRRRLDPATLSRTPSQEQLIAELQGRLGIQPEAEEPAEAAGPSAQDWLTEGVIITVQPRGKRAGGQLVEKVVFPPGSPIPLRRTISVLASPSVPLLQHRTDAAASSSSPLPSLLASSPLGPSAYTCGSSGVQSAGEEPHDEGVQGPALPIPAPHTMRSVGCQTDEDPLFPPMQAGLKGAPPFLSPVLMPEPSPTLHTHTCTHTYTDTLHPSIYKPQHSNHSPAVNLDPGLPPLRRSAALLLFCGSTHVCSFLDWSSVLPRAPIEERSHSRRETRNLSPPFQPPGPAPDPGPGAKSGWGAVLGGRLASGRRAEQPRRAGRGRGLLAPGGGCTSCLHQLICPGGRKVPPSLCCQTPYPEPQES
ncbi:paxillin isoform X4 [Homo sapiens]|nr:paxillin isoform X4 [Homo sapiens]